VCIKHPFLVAGEGKKMGALSEEKEPGSSVLEWPE